MMKNDFDECSYLSQVRRLRELAIEVLKEYPIKSYKLKFINHGENTTFKVMTKSGHYLLRIHCRSHRTKNAMLEELRWLKKLSQDSDISVQRPFLSNNGELLVEVSHPAVGHTRYCDLLEWQDGYILFKKTAYTAFAVGELLGNLQVHSMKSKYRRYWDTEGLIGKKATLGSVNELYVDFPRFSSRLEELRKFVFRELNHYEKRNKYRLCLIHGDLHFGNIIWERGLARPIDFDDCGYGLEMYDLAIPLASLDAHFKNKKKSLDARNSFLEGYAFHKELSLDDIKILPYLVATRELAMIGWLYGRRDNPALLEHLKKTLLKRMKRTQKYIEIGQRESFLSQ